MVGIYDQEKVPLEKTLPQQNHTSGKNNTMVDGLMCGV